jgi:hypothetical protein
MVPGASSDFAAAAVQPACSIGLLPIQHSNTFLAEFPYACCAVGCYREVLIIIAKPFATPGVVAPSLFWFVMHAIVMVLSMLSYPMYLRV